MDFKFNVGDTVKIVNILSQFEGRIGIIESRMYSNRSKVNKYSVDIGGCDLVQICWEKDIEEPRFCDGCLEYDCDCGYEQDEYNNLDMVGYISDMESFE